MAYWAACRLQANRTALALHFLNVQGYEVYCPRLRELRVRRGRRVEVLLPLFPGYTFVRVMTGWWQARWAPGTCGLGWTVPHRLRSPTLLLRRSGRVSAKVRSSSHPRIRPGDRVRVLRGPFRDRLAIYAGMSGRDRVAVLLRLLGGERRLLLHRCDVKI
jgi:transcriptional antiterminator RfaH